MHGAECLSRGLLIEVRMTQYTYVLSATTWYAQAETTCPVVVTLGRRPLGRLASRDHRHPRDNQPRSQGRGGGGAGGSAYRLAWHRF